MIPIINYFLRKVSEMFDGFQALEFLIFLICIKMGSDVLVRFSDFYGPSIVFDDYWPTLIYLSDKRRYTNNCSW